MTFTEITADEFRTYAASSPYKSFMQTPEIATYREQNGWTAYYLAVKQGNEIKAATMLVAKPTFLGKSTFIAPGGPLLDLADAATTTFFGKNLRAYVKSHNGYILHVSPYYELVQRDRNGELVPGGFNHEEAKANLLKLGFHELSTSDQPKYLFALDIENRTPDELLASFKRNTRNHIRKAEKMGVTIRELERGELGILKQITESTSQRRHFTDRPLSYYEQMYDLFTPLGEVKFIVAETSLEGNGGGVSETIERQRERSERSSAHDDGPEQARRENTTLVPKGTHLSAAMFMLYGDEIIYLFSGSDEKYMRDYNAQYLIQWHMIKYAAEHGFKRYNFYGINGLPDPSSSDYGIYDFKKGFGGEVIELIGSYELPTGQVFYRLHRLLARLKHH